MPDTRTGETAQAPVNGTDPLRHASVLTAEQKQQLRQEMLTQAAAKLENARVNHLMAAAAYSALLNDLGH